MEILPARWSLANRLLRSGAGSHELLGKLSNIPVLFFPVTFYYISRTAIHQLGRVWQPHQVAEVCCLSELRESRG